MKFRFILAALLGLLAITALAGGGDQSLVSPRQPHAVISTAMPAGPNHYRVQIIWLDGKYLSTDHRRTAFWVSPGEHTIGFRVIINPSRGPAVMLSPAFDQPQNLRTLKLTLKRDMTYYFAAKIPDANPSRWQPVVIKRVGKK